MMRLCFLGENSIKKTFSTRNTILNLYFDTLLLKRKFRTRFSVLYYCYCCNNNYNIMLSNKLKLFLGAIMHKNPFSLLSIISLHMPANYCSGYESPR